MFRMLSKGAPLAILGAAITSSMASAKDISVTADQIAQMDIKTDTVERAATQSIATLPGLVKPALNARTSITAPFGGTVVQIHVLPGQYVNRGDPLITISSRDLLEVQGQIAQAEAEFHAAEAIASRKRQLVAKNLASATIAEEADAQVAKIKAVLEKHQGMTTLGGIRIGEGGQYVIPAPMDGRVIEASAMPGQRLDAMDAAAALDANTDLTVEAQVPQRLVEQIRAGDDIQVVGGPRGRVIAIGGTLDPKTRSALLIASVPSQSGLISGQMVTISLVRPAPSGALKVPATAVAWIGDQNAVFVREATGFRLVPVEVQGKSRDSATIAGSLAEGAEVASAGLPQLELMMGGD